MTITLTGASGAEYAFDVYTDKQSLPTNSGVYILLCRTTYGPNDYKVLYIGEAGDVHERLTSGEHNGLECAEEECLYDLHFGVHETIGYSKEDRQAIEKDLIDRYNPDCNKQ